MKTILCFIKNAWNKYGWVSKKTYNITNNLNGKFIDLDKKVDDNQKISCQNHKETQKLIIDILMKKDKK